MELSRREKRAIRLQICHILDEHCGNCDFINQPAKGLTVAEWNKVRNDLQRYCNTECLIGKKMQELNNRLLVPKEEPKPIKIIRKPKQKLQKSKDVRTKKNLTPEIYMQEKRKGFRDWQIMNRYNISSSALYARKRKWREQGLLIKHIQGVEA
ncbi:hypothetical protein [Aneurinibacillus aneurinilyticus]|uniref:Uncharacterized protein n=1 Tax=Aneurinibacillus aneurinilyticus TaxID=1391 RepID=A0A848CXT1_ANEAE|nr:hypothetical protein [Aneurinibacillus aneurinilyticus]NMF00256.1 hypothetical protein [Aneurinibacillus aneurinilyticus]